MPVSRVKKTMLPNQGIINNLKILEEYERIYKNPFKANAYQKVIDNLEVYEKDIKTVEDLKEIKGVGKSIQEKILEYISTNKIQAVDDALADRKYILGKQLLGIYGIGPAKVQELLETLTSFDDLKGHPELLNAKQQIGLRYYDDLQTRIPFSEGKNHYKIIKKAIQIVTSDKSTQFEMVGSYRRKNKDLGDIDILIKDTPSFDLKAFIGHLQSQKYIIEVLASGKNKFMGICKLADDLPARRIDVLVADNSYYYFALLYFTGSYMFNIYMRKIALQKGLSLSEYGFKDNNTKQMIDTSDVIRSEEDIFKYLDIPFVLPNKR
jgi:DNA polymerase/3'-5' exonuclease PolX